MIHLSANMRIFSGFLIELNILVCEKTTSGALSGPDTGSKNFKYLISCGKHINVDNFTLPFLSFTFVLYNKNNNNNNDNNKLYY